MSRYDDKKQVKCSFAVNHKNRLKDLLQVRFICDECIELCSEILMKSSDIGRDDMTMCLNRERLMLS